METTTLPSSKKLKIEAAKYGLYLGLISTAITLIIFYASPALMGSPAFGFISIILTLGLSIYFILELRKRNGGYWAFGEALPNIFIVFFVSMFSSAILMLGFSKVEPTYEETMRSIMLNSMTELGERLSPNNPEVVDAMIEETEKGLDKQFNPTIGQFLQGQAITAITCFIFALIFALIFKRNRPVFVVPNEEEDYTTEYKG
jgi:hypothetical protein